MSCWIIQEGGIQRWKNITEGFGGEKGYKGSSTTEHVVVKDLETEKGVLKWIECVGKKIKGKGKREMGTETKSSIVKVDSHL